MKRRGLGNALQKQFNDENNVLRNTIIVPKALQKDPTGIVRSFVFGLRLLHIANNKDDEAFKDETLNTFNRFIRQQNDEKCRINI